MRDLGLIDNAKLAQAQSADLAVGNRQNAQGQNYAVDYIRQQVINAVGWGRAMNEGFRIRTTIDGELQKVAEGIAPQKSRQSGAAFGYDHQTYAQYAASFRAAKSSGTASSQPAPEYLQGAVIGLNNDTGGILVLVGGRDFEHQPIRSRASSENVRPGRRCFHSFTRPRSSKECFRELWSKIRRSIIAPVMIGRFRNR